jgi:hypothetical protein
MTAAVAELRRPAKEGAPADPLAALRAPFPPNQISKLPKPFKKDAPKGKCPECGGYHGLPAVHLDYVGHAALTDRLLDVDPHWTWEPVADPASMGLPIAAGGMWIKLTVCGVSRYGFGHPDGKTGGDAVKETIGDALRNAAMRFGAALDLWHKGDLHAEEEAPTASAEELAINHLRSCAVDGPTFKEAWSKNKDGWKGVMDPPAYAKVVAEMKKLAAKFSQPAEAPAPPPPPAEDFGIGEDEIPF